MTQEMVNCFVLPNGLKVAHRRVSSPVECCGVAINAGSRDETPDRFGLAHFVEHTIFKGTERRRPFHIINRMEKVGGELNAYTTKEETMIYSMAPRGNLSRAVDLIADLVMHSVFTPSEIDKERDVVEEEINSYLDTPAEAVFDDFDDRIFAGSQLGHNILGDTATIARLDSATCRQYIHSNYVGERMVFFYVGPATADRVRQTVEAHFASLAPTGTLLDRKEPRQVEPFCERRKIDTHQAHTVIGARIPSLYSPDIYAIGLVSNILGGPGMNSRLNVALRERRGLVYTVDSSTAMFTDAGVLTIYYGCDPDDNDRCADLVRRELEKISTEGLTQRQLAAAKKQYLGQIAVAGINQEQLALGMAREVLFKGRSTPAAEVRSRIEAITADDILRVAAHLDPSRCSLLTLG